MRPTIPPRAAAGPLIDEVPRSDANVQKPHTYAVTPRQRIESTSDHRASMAVRIIIARYSESAFGLSMLARLLRLSPAHTSRLIHKYAGAGFLTIVHRLRIDHAGHLLGTTAYSVKEIAGLVGYNHTNELIRHFRRHHQITPTSFRARPRPSVPS